MDNTDIGEDENTHKSKKQTNGELKGDKEKNQDQNIEKQLKHWKQL